MVVVQESHGDWKQPVILVPKADELASTVNILSKFDTYLMPCTDELHDWLITFIQHCPEVLKTGGTHLHKILSDVHVDRWKYRICVRCIPKLIRQQ